MGSLKALATQKTGKFEERAKLEKYLFFKAQNHQNAILLPKYLF